MKSNVAVRWSGFVVALLLSGCLGGGGGSKSNDSSTVNPDASAAGVTDAKAAVAELRTWSVQLNDLSKTADGSLNAQAAMANASAPIVMNTLDTLGFALRAMGNAFLSGTPAPYDLAVYMPIDFVGTASGTITRSGNQMAIANGTINGDTVNVTINVPELTGAEYKLDVVSAQVTNASSFARVDTGTANVKYASSTSISDIASGVYTELPENFSFDLKVTVGQVVTPTVTNPVQFSGTLSGAAKKYFNLTQNAFRMNPSHYLLGGEFKDAKSNGFSAVYEIYMRNAATYVGVQPLPIGHVNNNVGSYAFSNGGHTITIVYPSQTVSFTHNPATNVVHAKYVYTYSFSSTPYSFEYDLSGTYTSLANFLATAGSFYIPTWAYVDGEGRYQVTLPTTWNPAGGALSGTLQYPEYVDENAAMWRDLDGSLTFTGKLTGLPEAQVRFAFDRVSFNKVNTAFSIQYGNVQIKVENLDDGVSDPKAKITVTVKKDGSTTVVEIVNNPKDVTNTSGIVTVNGVTVGTLQVTKSGALVMNYVDGTFETVAN